MRLALVLLALAGGAFFFFLNRDRSSAPVHKAPPSVAAASQSPAEAPVDRAPKQVDRVRYVLDYKRETSIGPQSTNPTFAVGVWTTEPVVAGGHTEVLFQPVRAGALQDEPDAESLATPFQLGFEGGRLATLGFEPGLDALALDLLTELATAFHFTPGAGPTWEVEEEDLSGRYRATYERTGPTSVRRTRRYTALRTPKGLKAGLSEAVQVEGETRFEFDDHGLVRVVVAERSTFSMEGQQVAIEVRIRGTLEREEARAVEQRPGAELVHAGIQSRVPTQSRADRDAELLGEHDLASLLAAFAELERLPARGKETSRWRADQFLRLRALLRLHPDQAEALARALRERAGGDRRAVSLLAKALGAAGTPQARAALVQLLGEADLPAGARQQVAVALNRTDNPSAETAGALKAAMEAPELGSAPALALGNEARALAESDPEVAEDAVTVLLERYAAATTLQEKRMYLQALGNTGDPRALPVMRDALSAGNPQLAEVAAFGLRFIPGPEADALLNGLLEGPALTNVRLAAIQAIALRDPTDWRPRLVAVRERERSDKVRTAIERVLQAWPG